MKYIYINNLFIQKKNRLKYLIYSILICLIFNSCDYEENLADVVVKDPIRHYYPVVQGQKLSIIVKLENKSDFPFKISDIQTSCGCIILKEGILEVIPAQSTGILELTYDSNKNIGLVNHFIYIYGNLKKIDRLICDFDVHVVPDALYTPDYEELYRKEVEAEGGIKSMVEGDENEKGYYLSAGDSNGENNNTDLKF
jgi:hypothetical protein